MYLLKISQILKTKTFSQSSLTISSTVLNGILGVLFFIVLARSLGPEYFGIVTFTIAFITLVADIANLGTDTGIIKFVGKYLSQGEDKKFIKLGLELKIFAWAAVFLVGWLCVPFIAAVFFNKAELVFPLRLALFGIGGSLLYSFITSSLQAYQKYLAYSLIMIGTNLLRFILVVILVTVSFISVENALLIYMVVPFLGFFAGIFILPGFLTVKNEWSVAREFFHYNKWIALISLTSAVGSRLDTFMITKFISITEVGIYSVAAQLTAFIPQIFFALASVAAPKLASFEEKSKAIVYYKKLQLLTIGMAAVGLLGIPLGFVFIPIFYGNAYLDSVLPFIILLIGQLLFLLSLPSHQVIYYFYTNPKIIFFTAVLETLTIAISGLVLIPKLGIIGASVSILLGGVVIFVLPFAWILVKFSQKK